MIRFSFLLAALLTFAVCLAATCPARGFAMGTKSGFEQIREDEIQKEQTDKSAGGKKWPREGTAKRSDRRERREVPAGEKAAS